MGRDVKAGSELKADVMEAMAWSESGSVAVLIGRVFTLFSQNAWLLLIRIFQVTSLGLLLGFR
jgi:hypothetical protein